jgi:hypothetical protein
LEDCDAHSLIYLSVKKAEQEEEEEEQGREKGVTFLEAPTVQFFNTR